MKRVILLLILAILFINACNHSQKRGESVAPAQMDFKETIFDFKAVHNGSVQNCTFEFRNTSSVPLTISNVIPSCECSSPKWPKKPIQPGKSGIIEIEYHPAGVGPFRKSITIFSNAKNSPIHLYIKGEIFL